MGLAALLSSGLILSACGETSGGEAVRAKVREARFDRANFGHPATGASPWLPLKPGTQWVREGSTLVGDRKVPHQVTVTVTDVYRVIDGVRTVAVLDYEVDSGQISQESLDYMAEDRDGNVWVLGGYTEEYEGGRFVSAEDAWLSGVKGAKFGLLVPAEPRVGSPPYAVAAPDAEERDVAEVVKVRARHCVPFKCFDDVLIVREGKESNPDNELKYYARDVGQIDNVPQTASRHKDIEQLVNLTELSPKALAEASAEALRLDRNARKQAPGTFGRFPPAKRG
ncbi:MAG: hypothetical protein ACRDPC_02380 [Solirubrobacteraceae bacterium]